MMPFISNHQCDHRLRIIARFARFCLARVEFLLHIEASFRHTLSVGDNRKGHITTLSIITALTRITTVAARLMRYAERPRPPCRYSLHRPNSWAQFRVLCDQPRSLPLGHDACSIMALKICAKARAMISRDQLYRFGEGIDDAHIQADPITHAVKAKPNSPATDDVSIDAVRPQVISNNMLKQWHPVSIELGFAPP